MVNFTRRQFLQTSSGIGAGAVLFSQQSFAADLDGIPLAPNKKSLVFIMLDGGNDSFNMLVPQGVDYQDYKATRGGLALNFDPDPAQTELLPLSGFSDKQGREFYVHSKMPEVKSLFESKKLAFVANVGPLVEPTSKQAYINGSAKLPVGLLSHSDQFKHWQTSRPDQRTNNGWFGAFADKLQAMRPASQIPMNISLSGSNIMQNGVESGHYSITEKGSVGLKVKESSGQSQAEKDLNRELLASFNALLQEDYSGDPLKQSFLAQTREAQAQHEKFKLETDKVSVTTSFDDSPLAQQLKKTAQSIKAAGDLNLNQQTYFLRYIGWDHHDGLKEGQEKMLGVLSRALSQFQTELQVLGVDDDVITFTGSDFGRTLTSNGNGSDHGWGGNTIVMGSSVEGGKVYGEYPSLKLGSANPQDAGNGIIIPTTPTDKLYAELSIWMGLRADGAEVLFPNIQNFGGVKDKQPPMGFALKAAQVVVPAAGGGVGGSHRVPTLGGFGLVALWAGALSVASVFVRKQGLSHQADNGNDEAE